MEKRHRPPRLPRATHRVQVHGGFTFDDAAAQVPYLAELGISHLYTSPILMARPGSGHGYDITDHARLNPELGGTAGLERLVRMLHRHGMGLIIDFVPNHMGVGGSDNPWWLDVLEWGRASPFSGFFDIDWEPAEPTLSGKVLLPFLGDHYGKVLERGELKLTFDSDRGTFAVRYWDQVFPIAVKDYPGLLREVRDLLSAGSTALGGLITAFAGLRPVRRQVSRQAVVRAHADEAKAKLAALAADNAEVRGAIDAVLRRYAGDTANPASFRPLHRLLERQAYRMSYWRVATWEINYRRFFDINDLAGLRMEQPELFEVSHQRIFRMIADGHIQGIRLDHIDGLYDPATYCRQLQDRAAYLTMQSEPAGDAAVPTPEGLDHPFYVLVEKILARHERLRDDWAVHGTTGYEFMNLVNGLFVNPAGERVLTQVYDKFIDRSADFEGLALDAKRQIVETNLASELNVLASNLLKLARQSWRTRDFTLDGLRNALIEVVAHFPVYRTYISDRGLAEDDRRYLDWAVTQARKHALALEPSMFEFLHGVLTTDLIRERGQGYRKADILGTAMKFQQFTGPVMAKAIEDTTFYRYYRLTSLNEVGGEPVRFGVSTAAFHHLNQERLRRHPYTMIATATHDHKRGEDTRTRINVLSELAPEWRTRVRRWAQLNRGKRRQIDIEQGRGRNDEYLFYQTLLGVWPTEPGLLEDPEALSELADRLIQYMIKAVREGKWNSSWAQPNLEYEQGLEAFVRRVLNPGTSAAFLSDFQRFQAQVALVGAANSLAQTLLKLTVPGVPDIYQGTDYWDYSLVDPDNRRPVDYGMRVESLRAAPSGSLASLLESWRDGRVKQAVIARTLRLRKQYPGLFAGADYVPLETTGSQSDRAVAFLRQDGDDAVIVVVPRLVAPLLGEVELPLPPAGSWGSTGVSLPPDSDGRRWTDIFTDRSVEPGHALRIADLLGAFPVALLVSTTGGQD